MTEDLLVWSADFSVGLDGIDAQHQELVDMLNRLHVAIKHHHGSDAAHTVLDDLAAYTQVHFKDEEAMMIAYDYPEFEAHRHMHEELMAQVRDLQSKIASGNAKITYELLHFLKVWLTEHIKGSDRKFGAYALAAREHPTPPVFTPPPNRDAHRPWWKFWQRA